MDPKRPYLPKGFDMAQTGKRGFAQVAGPQDDTNSGRVSSKKVAVSSETPTIKVETSETSRPVSAANSGAPTPNVIDLTADDGAPARAPQNLETSKSDNDAMIDLTVAERSTLQGHPTAVVPFTTSEVFPLFRSGDVIISTKLGEHQRRYQLHSAVLVRDSKFFEAAIREAHVTEIQPKFFYFEFEEDPACSIPKLVRKTTILHPRVLAIDQAQVKGAPAIIKTEDTPDSDRLSTIVRSSDDSSASPGARVRPSETTILKVFSQVLGTFYNIPPAMETSGVITALMHSEILIKVAEDLDCLALLRPHLGNLFPQFRQSLYTSIKNDPPRWLKISLALHNTMIYTEALIHLIGAYPTWQWPSSKKAVPSEIHEFIKKKALELQTQSLEVQRNLFLVTIHENNGKPITINSLGYIDTWIAIQIFRDYISSQLSLITHKKRGTQNPHKLGSFIRKLARGGDAYLSVEEVKDMLHGNKRCARMEGGFGELSEDLGKLKHMAKGYVADLAKNELLIEPEMNSVGYLTCVKIGEADVPWVVGGREKE